MFAKFNRNLSGYQVIEDGKVKELDGIDLWPTRSDLAEHLECYDMALNRDFSISKVEACA